MVVLTVTLSKGSSALECWINEDQDLPLRRVFFIKGSNCTSLLVPGSTNGWLIGSAEDSGT